jgi:hypothetical protein
MIKLDFKFKFDQGRLNNLSTMLNLKSLWKYDPATKIILKPKHTCIDHGKITMILLKVKFLFGLVLSFKIYI